jgi:hypothetical protein
MKRHAFFLKSILKDYSDFTDDFLVFNPLKKEDKIRFFFFMAKIGALGPLIRDTGRIFW